MAYVDFKKLKARVSLREILDHYDLLADLEETPQGFEGLCPFCGSNAFKVNVQKNVWFCFGECKTSAEEDGSSNGGNILDFVMKREGDTPLQAAQRIARWFPEGDEVHDRPHKRVARAEGDDAAKPARRSREKPKTAGGAEGASAEGEGKRTAPQKEAPTDERPAVLELAPEPDLTTLRNTPLGFALRSVTYEHEVLEALGCARETLEAFGVGYFTGKGIMHNKVVIPIHNRAGELVAYGGYAPEDGILRYPDGFDPRLELFNTHRTRNGVLDDAAVLVTDPLHVLRLYELGVIRAVALPTATIHAPQLVLLEELVGKGGLLDLVLEDNDRAIIDALLPRFHVKLYRRDGEPLDDFLAHVTRSLWW